MHTLQLPPWPSSIPKVLTPWANVRLPEPFNPDPHVSRLDAIALHQARLRRAQSQFVQNSSLTQTWTEAIFVNRSDFSALSSFTTEASLLGGTNQQPVFPSLLFDGVRGVGRAFHIRGSGVLSSTGTPTYLLTFRLGTTLGSSYLSGTAIGVTAAITTASGITNKEFWFELDMVCRTPGLGSGNTTLAGAGYVCSPGGFASPFSYPIQPTTPDTATWTATIDAAATQYLNVSCTCSASSASNTITLKNLWVLGMN